MACKFEAMVSLQQCGSNGKATVGNEKMIIKAQKIMKNISNALISNNLVAYFGYPHVVTAEVNNTTGNVAVESSMKAGRKDFSMHVNESNPNKEDKHVSSDEIYEIDLSDSDSPSHIDYIKDMYEFYRIAEKSNQPRDYMNSQSEINEEMRAYVCDRLIQIHSNFQLMPETLYLSFQIMDRYLSIKTVQKRELNVLGISSMLIASKYEERRTKRPQVDELAFMYGAANSRLKILRMEKEILNMLDWSLTVPTVYVFLVRFIKAARADEQMEEMTFFFSELALIHYSMIIYKPSLVAASAVYAASCALRKLPFWTKTLEYHTGYKSCQLLKCVAQLLSFHTSAAAKTKAVFSKYSGCCRIASFCSKGK